jgi:hypothetical protein
MEEGARWWALVGVFSVFELLGPWRACVYSALAFYILECEYACLMLKSLPNPVMIGLVNSQPNPTFYTTS